MTTTESSTKQPKKGGCSIWWTIGDAYCDDINNNMGCSYDGGDCCGPNINTQYCTDCSCLDPNAGNSTSTMGTTTQTTTAAPTSTTTVTIPEKNLKTY
jgi:hypothetical protein